MIKAIRPENAPKSLAESTAEDRYRNDDVVEMLAKMFNCKCYICEIGEVTDPVVEHLLPHCNGKYPERKYDWNNLFYACTHCNSVKNKGAYNDGVLNCCTHDPEDYLVQLLVEDRVSVQVLDPDFAEARRAARLIEEVFMSKNPALRKKGCESRTSKLQRQMNLLYTKLGEYGTENEDAFTKPTLAELLDRKAPFAGFARSYVRRHLNEYPGLEDCL